MWCTELQSTPIIIFLLKLWPTKWIDHCTFAPFIWSWTESIKLQNNIHVLKGSTWFKLLIKLFLHSILMYCSVSLQMSFCLCHASPLLFSSLLCSAQSACTLLTQSKRSHFLVRSRRDEPRCSMDGGTRASLGTRASSLVSSDPSPRLSVLLCARVCLLVYHVFLKLQCRKYPS